MSSGPGLGKLTLGLAWFEWHGLRAWALLACYLLLPAIMLWDMLAEDASWRARAGERALHALGGVAVGAREAVAGTRSEGDEPGRSPGEA